MPPIAGVTSSPFTNISNNLARQDALYGQRAELEDSMVSGITRGTPTPSLASFTTNAIQQGMLKTFLPSWIEEIKNLFKILKSFSSLATGANN